MNVNNENKLHELSLYANMNLNNININKQQNVNANNNKNDNNSSNTITRIKRKASTMNYQKRQENLHPWEMPGNLHSDGRDEGV